MSLYIIQYFSIYFMTKFVEPQISLTIIFRQNNPPDAF